MSSTERAPEPTMEEILASIRRIITDDEAGQTRGHKAAPQAHQDDESLEGEADNQIIDDIARVLSGGAPAAEAKEEEEEILDLANELGGLELVEDDEDEVLEVTEFAEVVEIVELPAEAEMSEAMPQAQAEAVAAEAEEEEPFADMPEPAPAPRMAAPQPPAPPVQQAPKLSASEEAASALERAIAALRAGQVPTSTSPQAEPFRFQTAPQPGPMPMPEPVPMAVPMPEPEPEPETHPEPESYFEAAPEFEPMLEPEAAQEPEGEPEPELVLTEIEVMEIVEEPAFEASAPEPETRNEPFWPVSEAAGEMPEEEPVAEPEDEFELELETETEPEPVVAQVNGGRHKHEGPSKTLEDSIKDMLRPMLREWLDENMPRIVREMDPEALRRHYD